MTVEIARPELCELPPLVGMRAVVASLGLERAADRAREMEELGYRVTTCGDPAELEQAIVAYDPGVVVIDLGRELAFPADVTQRARASTDALIVVVGCAGTQAELVRVFEAGGDDYCRPRCPTEEIDLRLRALARRLRYGGGATAQHDERVIRVGAIEIDPAAQTVRKHGELVQLSPTEYRLLLGLAERPGEVVPAKALIARVWGNQYAGESHYLRLYVRYLRQKLEDDPAHPRYIVNRWGAGYTLATPQRAA
ncbi:MAG: response regulator transcription factor [Dehalococcoidia bacterium]|nr:response regulator transcription factor [Dehalococcoidia bacterium]